MARGLDGSVLDLFGDLRGKHAAGFRMIGEIRMVSRVALDANFPTLLGHSKDEGPTIFGVQIGVRQYEKTLILVQQNILLEVLEDLSSVILLDFGVSANPGSNNPLPLKFI